MSDLSELDRRRAMLEELKKLSADLPTASEVRSVGMYGGAQGIYRDRTNTSHLTDDGCGVTVGILHTGKHYDDDMSDDHILYHYPKTGRPSSHDEGEIQATKNAKKLGLPIFVISAEGKFRHVNLGYVEDWDDESRTFLISFHDSFQNGLSTDSRSDDSEFELVSSQESKKVLVSARPNQAKFRFDVLKLYGPKCAVCHIRQIELLVAAHIRDKKYRGADDPRNGMVLCQNHHAAFDSHLWGVEPDELSIVVRDGLNLDAIGISETNLNHLRGEPHSDAINWRWVFTQKSWI